MKAVTYLGTEWFSVQGLEQCSSKSGIFNFKVEMKGHIFKKNFAKDMFCFLSSFFSSSFLNIGEEISQ